MYKTWITKSNITPDKVSVHNTVLGTERVSLGTWYHCSLGSSLCQECCLHPGSSGLFWYLWSFVCTMCRWKSRCEVSAPDFFMRSYKLWTAIPIYSVKRDYNHFFCSYTDPVVRYILVCPVHLSLRFVTSTVEPQYFLVPLIRAGRKKLNFYIKLE